MIDRLQREPYQFTFYQAVRLLLSQAATESAGVASADEPADRASDKQTGVSSHPDRSGRGRRGRLGTVSSILDEPVRFRAHPSLGFAPSEIVSLVPKNKDSDDESLSAEENDLPPLLQMEVAFWGLIGPAGALPNHYTQQVIDRVHVKDHAMRDFFDMFSHRQLSFFYRAWEKYFLAAGFENAVRQQNPQADLVREALLSFVGRGTKQVRDRLEAADDACVYYGGHFVDRPTAESLRAMVSDDLQLPAKVLSLFGQWLVLPIPELTRLGTVDGHCRMGIDTIVGGRTWDPSSKFRIQIGPVTWREFEGLMPTGENLVRICQFIRSYVGMEFDFDLQLILKAGEIPSCEFPRPSAARRESDPPPIKPHLGWNTWLCSKPPTRDSDDAVFHHDGFPTH